ncbi:MAG TPA: SGNH/GDSL hydrolase family protein [Polyangiaceae bacterium]|nr:SGNH/GDSL hydrolase family protein [Polyangiaceae bacterium]
MNSAIRNTPKLLLSLLALRLGGCTAEAPIEPAPAGNIAGSAGTFSSGGSTVTAGAGNQPSTGGSSAGNGGSSAGGDANTSGGSPVGGANAQAGAGGTTAGTAGNGDGGAGGAASSHWVGTWACAPQLTQMANLPPSPGLAGNTLRQMVHVSIGGARLRLRLSNQYGTSAVSMSSVHVAVSKGGGAIDAGTDHALTFAGVPSLNLAAGQSAQSDAFDFNLESLSDLAISIHFTSQSGDVTGHPGSRTTSFLQSGNAVTAASLPSAVKTEHWYFITGLDVMADADSAAIVVLGDSITDGRGSTTDKNNRWPDVLAKRLQANSATAKLGVLNMGIGGNSVLSGGIGPVALDRFDRDVIQQSGARWLIVLEGVNDLGGGADVTKGLTDAYETFIAKAHTANMRAYGVPILPIGGSSYAVGESVRQSVDDWIRTSMSFDAVIDLDAAVRDPDKPNQLLDSYDSGDHLHPSAAGYQKMGESVDLSLFNP